MKVVFFGTPLFAARILRFLVDQHTSLCAIVTQPDRPQGRNLQLAPSAVKQEAHESAPHIALLQPEKASDPQFLQALEDLSADLFVVAAYGQILPAKLLAIPKMGCINVHASLLPRYRGAAPMQRCLMNGERFTGVCIQKMVYQLDAGDVIDEARLEIPEDMTLGELSDALCALSQPLLAGVLKKYAAGIPDARAQDPDLVTIAPKIRPEETEIYWDGDAVYLHNQVRALSPRPGAWCWVDHKGRKRLRILRTHVVDRSGTPGKLLPDQKESCIVAAASQALQLIEVQPEGKKPMRAADWMRGCLVPPRFC